MGSVEKYQKNFEGQLKINLGIHGVEKTPDDIVKAAKKLMSGRILMFDLLNKEGEAYSTMCTMHGVSGIADKRISAFRTMEEIFGSKGGPPVLMGMDSNHDPKKHIKLGKGKLRKVIELEGELKELTTSGTT